MESGFHRSQWDAEQLTDVVERQVAIEAQGHDELKVRVELRKRRGERVPFRNRAEVVAASQFEDRTEPGIAHLPAPSCSEAVATQVEDDSPEPGVEARGVSQRAELAPADQNGVVDDVLGLGRVSEYHGRQPVRVVQTAVTQGLECIEGPSLPPIVGRHRVDHTSPHPCIVVAGGTVPLRPPTLTDDWRARKVRAPRNRHGPVLGRGPVCHNWGMVGRAATNPEPGLASVPTLPAFERLAPPADAAEFVAAIEAWTKPGEVVLDLNGRGGWVARAAIAEQRRAADFETWPLTRLLADVVLRPPDLRQIESAAAVIANAPFSGSTIQRTIDALYASTCPRCGKPVVLEAMVWQPVSKPLKAEVAAAPKSRARAAARGAAAATSATGAKAAGAARGAGAAGSAAARPSVVPTNVGAMPEWAFVPGESLKAIAREYTCPQCREELGGADLRTDDATYGDIRLAESVPSSGDVREAVRRRFPGPRPTHPLVDQLIDLHTPRQLLGLHAILTRIDAEDRVGAVTAALRLAFLHAVIIASRLNVSRGKPAQLRIANGVLKVPVTQEWREVNPWQAFEDGLKLVKTFVQRLETGTPRAAFARLAADLAALEAGTANVVIGETTPGSLRRLGLHGERMSHSDSPSRVRLVLGQAPMRWTPERLAASYHGTAWVFGPAAVGLLPYDALFRPPVKVTASDEAMDLARSVGRTLAIATPALAQTGRAVILLDDSEPETLIAAALGGAAAGCRLVDARLRRGGDDSDGMAVYVPRTGVMEPGPRTRANRPLPPVVGGAGDPGTIVGRGVFGRPEKLDEGPFRSSVAAQTVTDTAVELLKARGEPASFEHLLGDLLIGLDKSGQLARLARALRPERADDGWAAWVEAYGVGPSAIAPFPDAAPASTTAAVVSHPPAGGRGRSPADEEDEASPLSPIDRLLEIIRDELDRPNNRRIRQIEPGQYWLASDEDRGRAAQPLADRVEWAVFSLLSSGAHMSERAAIDRTAGLFKGGDVPDGALIEACLASYLAPGSTPDAVAGFEQLEARTVDHDRVITELADLGHRLGMRVWIGKRQQTHRVDGQPLGSWLDEAEREVHLPLITWAPEGELDRVDCAWYVRRRASFLFEVEWTAMLGDPVLVHHARYPADDKVVRFIVLPQARAELAKVKLARSPLLRKAIEERNWHFLKWNHLAEFAARPEATLADLEPYLGLDAAADTAGEQLPLFGG